jgi:pSer/pThr/pTyr-binding forkhead associated (FHA) protein
MPEGVKTTMYWVLGIGIIALVGLVMLILFGNLSGNVGFGQDTLTFTNSKINVTDTATDMYTLTGYVNPAISSVTATFVNGTTIASGNYTIVGNTIKIAGAENNGTFMNISGTLSYDEQGKIDTDSLINNYTTSVGNTGKQFPVVGTIVGIALLLVILIGILTFAVKKLMGVTGSSSGSSSKFSGSISSDLG